MLLLIKYGNTAALMKVMLAFLLFAGAIHIDFKKLKTEGAAIITFSTMGVLIELKNPPPLAVVMY